MTPHTQFRPRKYTVLNVLLALERLFEDSRRWTKKVSARSRYVAIKRAGIDMSTCSAFADEARCWCLGGSLDLILKGQRHSLYTRVKKQIENSLHRVGPYYRGESIIEFNDHPDTRIQDVQALIGRAIRAERAIKRARA